MPFTKLRRERASNYGPSPIADKTARERAIIAIAEVEKIMAAKRARREELGQLPIPGS